MHVNMAPYLLVMEQDCQPFQHRDRLLTSESKEMYKFVKKIILTKKSSNNALFVPGDTLYACLTEIQIPG